MRSRIIWFACAALVLASVQTASAMSVVLPSDEALVDQAHLVVEGTVSDIAFIGNGTTQYIVRINRLFKGASGSDVIVTMPGGPDVGGSWRSVPGTPRWNESDHLLLFLVPQGVITTPVDLVAGAFRVLPDKAFGSVAVRDLQDVQVLSAEKSAEDHAQFGRDLSRFERWVSDRAAGITRAPDYLAKTNATIAAPDGRKFYYAFLQNDLPVHERWQQFDRGEPVMWQVSTWFAPQGHGGVQEFLTAMAAWNAVASTNINYTYGGLTDSHQYLEISSNPADWKNIVFLNDPEERIPGRFSCSTVGIIAMADVWSDGGFDGPDRIRESHIYLNDGTACWFNTSKNAEGIFGHELGHTLGLGHPCSIDKHFSCPKGVEPLMRAEAYSDSRGARITVDDEAGVFVLYGGDLDPPIGLKTASTGKASVTVTWQDESDVEQAFWVQVKKGKRWATVAKAPANATSATVNKLKAGTKVTMRVLAVSGQLSTSSPQITFVVGRRR